MISVHEATAFIQSTIKDYGRELIPFEAATGRILAEDIKADRDLPPYNRVSMDGIAIKYSAFEKGTRLFKVKGVQPAGITPIEINSEDECIEIMTGAALPVSTDTVIRYEDILLSDGKANLITDNISKAQSIHFKGSDKKKNEVVVNRSQLVTAAIISIAASVGKSTLLVKKLPSVLIISTGNELVDVQDTPSDYELRRSNNYTIKAVLKRYGIGASMEHLPDDEKQSSAKLKTHLLQYDVILLTGGISMGRFDHVPAALETCGVKKIFHKVQQRPGKPFWFGRHDDGALVFGFPGNPVSTFLCLQRYFIPWLEACLEWKTKKIFAVLTEDISFKPALQYFLQVKVQCDESGRLLATPVAGNGSGDFANLTLSDAFMELPMERDNFKKDEAFPIWPFNHFF